MRLSVLPNISTKDGTSNKNARLTNMLKVSGPKDIAEIRPGLVGSATTSGAAGGLVSFNGELISVYGTTLGKGIEVGGDAAFYSVPDMELRGAANLGGDSWLLWGQNISGDAEVYTGDSAGSMVLDSFGFAVTADSSPVIASTVAASATTVIVAKNQSLQKSTIGGSLSFSTVESITGSRQYFSIKYLGGKFVAISVRTSTGQSTVRWSSDDGATWASWNAPTTDTIVYDVAYDGTNWWIFYFDDGAVELGAFKTSDFVTFTPQTFSGMNTFSSGGGYSAAYGGGYFYTSCSEDSTEGVAYYSTNGLAWVEMPELISHFGEAASGSVYANNATTFYSVLAGVATVENSDFTLAYGFGANATGTAFMVFELSADYGVVSGGNTIPALTTIQAGKYDFAQNVI